MKKQLSAANKLLEIACHVHCKYRCEFVCLFDIWYFPSCSTRVAKKQSERVREKEGKLLRFQNEWTAVFSLGSSAAADPTAKLWNGCFFLWRKQVRDLIEIKYSVFKKRKKMSHILHHNHIRTQFLTGIILTIHFHACLWMYLRETHHYYYYLYENPPLK